MLQRRLMVMLAAAAASLICWMLLPGTALDRAAFNTVARGFANPPFFISGNGSHSSPWKLQTFASSGKPDLRQAPVIVSLGDDLEGFFQSSPPSPIDLAVILTNFQRLGAGKAATAAVLAWDSPDPIGLAALDKAISRFDSLVMAAPLSRGAVPEPMPSAFRNASIPLDRVRGDRAALPVVNRIPLPGVILGSENTLAGFQSLDSEPRTKFAPLLARWEDRVVFSFALLTVLQRLDLNAEGVEIRLGEYLKLSPRGPIVPIDPYGRLSAPLKPVSPYAEIPAESLIDGGGNLFPKQAPEPVILRDDRSAAEPSTRAFSKSLPAIIAAIASDTGLSPAHEYARPGQGSELLLLLVVVLVLAAICGLPDFPRDIGFLIIASLCLSAQLIGAGSAMLWLPGLPAIAAVGCAFLVSRFIAITPAVHEPSPVRPPRAKPRISPEPAPLATGVPVKPDPKNPSPKKRRQRGKKHRR